MFALVNSLKILKYTQKDVHDMFKKNAASKNNLPFSDIRRLIYLPVYILLRWSLWHPRIMSAIPEGHVSLSGLPDEIEFKKPNNCDNDKIQRIMACQDKIEFHIPAPSEQSNIPEFDTKMNCNILCKLIDKKKALKAPNLYRLKKVTLRIISSSVVRWICVAHFCRDYFTFETFDSLKAAYNTHNSHSKYIFPVCTVSEDKYWLFYSPGRMSDVTELQEYTRLSGYCLHPCSGLCYKLLLSNEKEFIEGVNIIPRRIEPNHYLFLKKSLELKDGFWDFKTTTKINIVK